jgi:hypothetical protein
MPAPSRIATDTSYRQHVWATRRDSSYLKYLALHFTVHGAGLAASLASARYCEMRPALTPAATAAQGFSSSTAPSFPCFVRCGKIRLSLVVCAWCVRWCAHQGTPLTARLPDLLQDYCLLMPNFESQATLPQYFLLKARCTARMRVNRCMRCLLTALRAPHARAAPPELCAKRCAAVARHERMGGLRVVHEPGCVPRQQPARKLHDGPVAGSHRRKPVVDRVPRSRQPSPGRDLVLGQQHVWYSVAAAAAASHPNLAPAPHAWA